MGVLSDIFGAPVTTPQAGMANGDAPGHLGMWVKWDAKLHSVEVFRVVVRAESITGLKVPSVTYTFGPAFDRPFCQSIETSYQLKEFLVGRNHSVQGTVYFDFLMSGTNVLTVSFGLEEVIKCMRGKGPSAPAICQLSEKYLEVDSADLAALKHTDLKAYSEKIKAELEEKRRKEEEERKAKEAAAAEALKKAQAAAQAASSGGAAKAPSDGPTVTSGRVAIFFGSSTGNTENVAKQIKDELGCVDHIKNVAECHPLDFAHCEVMIFGIPTWHIGELQDDWASILPNVGANNYAGKKIAVFGLGDGKGYAETYVDAMAELIVPFEKGGAKLHGLWPTDGYDYKKSKAIRDGKFLGLVIDVENQDNLSDKRIKAWCGQIKSELGL